MPTKVLTLLLRLLDKPDQTVRVKFEDNQVLFSTDSATLTIALADSLILQRLPGRRGREIGPNLLAPRLSSDVRRPRGRRRHKRKTRGDEKTGTWRRLHRGRITQPHAAAAGGLEEVFGPHQCRLFPAA